MQLSLICSLLLVFPFYFTDHPLAMTLIILLQTLIIALIPSTMLPSFWFSYILFLVFLGGMLVLFIYITSLAANEIFKPKIKYILFPLISIMTLLIFTFLIDKTLLSSISNNSDLQSMLNKDYYNESTYTLTELYNTPTKILTLMLVCYLFLTLIVVVKVTNIFLGPLRQQY